jgi:hypothetical protein
VPLAIGEGPGGVADAPLSAEVVVCSNCCGMLADDETSWSTKPGNPGIDGATVSAVAVALDANPATNRPAAAPAVMVMQFLMRDMALPIPMMTRSARS